MRFDAADPAGISLPAELLTRHDGRTRRGGRHDQRLLATDRLRSRTAEMLPLSAAAEARKRVERGQLHGERAILGPRWPVEHR
ncbi:hypothetical protein ACQPYK_27775 [Streptosporangium sp. CA-135522]|uniref:hypothetical protein n=1 Tax=Streptosporangium sp. CA-135522 TaxID=3240072 RepID=UPI003D8C085F